MKEQSYHSIRRNRRRIAMPGPDKETIIRRLQALQLQAEIFEKMKSSTHRTAEFDIWRSEVYSWFQKGSPYTDEQRDAFLSVSFTPISYQLDQDQRWCDGLKMAKHLIDRAIENLEQGWATPSEDTGAATNQAPLSGITIVNQNIQQNTLTIGTVLEEIAREIDRRRRPRKARGSERTLEKIAQNPITKSILETALVGGMEAHLEELKRKGPVGSVLMKPRHTAALALFGLVFNDSANWN